MAFLELEYIIISNLTHLPFQQNGWDLEKVSFFHQKIVENIFRRKILPKIFFLRCLSILLVRGLVGKFFGINCLIFLLLLILIG
ncbi:hypothetical protein IEQ34_001355 [Dendrobium chrysotoxum]|uniref:Uncharacterized protein n=1 Tax=Dendrobium chrysotoxum TaxID=161865 RepID=A0AAV7HLL6_DENCH|nr:hypothetical protein IEQ34_001355 [Dendrobium chrysotoxum]